MGVARFKALAKATELISYKNESFLVYSTIKLIWNRIMPYNNGRIPITPDPPEGKNQLILRSLFTEY